RINVIGYSVKGKEIHSLEVGNGKTRVLMWSQMHGNETTTTKAIFDLLNTFKKTSTDIHDILNKLTIKIIPILNVDGAQAYTRENANGIDLNRDALNLSQPETVALREIFKEFDPDYCFNLHGQRTIFSAGNKPHPASISFLSPAQDENCSITPNRKVAMAIVNEINESLQDIIPNSVGIYDDSYNLNCVGDYFQKQGVPTILFEAGHYPGDYQREYSRYLIYHSYLVALDSIAKESFKLESYQEYFKLPQNQKLFYDIIVRNAKISEDSSGGLVDICIQYGEKLENGKINFLAKIEKFSELGQYYAHKEIDARNYEVRGRKNQLLDEHYSNDFVLINNELLSLKLLNNSF
ncbi:MAG: M14 family zinc carboxypeptidase, partial [Flavobacteriaceae bacterium]|nr:M14 family zinc carboxypeptidase [Flavobacteriaceae bacterium]